MPETMNPREKVDCVGCEGRPAPENNPCAVCGRAALASSGDHAELARLAEAATPGPWRVSENNNPFADGRHVFATRGIE